MRLRVDMSSGTVRYTAHCGVWWVRLLVCSCLASFVRVFVRLFVFLELFVCRYSFVVRSLAFGMLFVVRAFWQSAGPPGLIPARRPRHARHCCDIGMCWSLCPAIPHDCDCVRSGDVLFEILSCPTVWIHADMRVVRGTMLYGTWQNIVAQQVKSRNRCRTRPCMSCEAQWKAVRTYERLENPGKAMGRA